MEKIREVLGRLMNLRVYYQIGEICTDYNQLPDIYRKVESTFPDILVQKGGTHPAEVSAEKICRTFVETLKTGNQEEVEAVLRRVIESVAEENFSRLAAQYVFSNCLQGILEAGADRELSLPQNYIENIRNMLLEDTIELAALGDGFLQLLDAYFDQLFQTDKLSSYLQKALRYIDSHFHENVSMTEVADVVGISSNYLSKLFNTQMQTSFPAYILEKRLEHALRLMDRGEGNVRQIAAACGFQSYEYFFYVFKKKMHQTPKEYMERKHE